MLTSNGVPHHSITRMRSQNCIFCKLFQINLLQKKHTPQTGLCSVLETKFKYFHEAHLRFSRTIKVTQSCPTIMKVINTDTMMTVL